MSTLLQELVAVQADRQPDASAIVADGTVTSYQDLEARSNQLARVLREHGCRRGDRICVFAPRSAAAIVAMLAVNKADAIYVPLGSSESSSHVRDAVAACQPSCILLSGSSAPTVESLFRSGVLRSSTVVGSLESSAILGDAFLTRFCLADVAAAPSRSVASRNRATNPAYLMFAPAKDGSVRGVVGTHTAVHRFVVWANHYFEVESDGRHPWHASPTHDWSMYEVLGPLAAGAAVCPIPSELELSPHRIADFIRRLRLTHWWTSPSAMKLLADADVVSPGDFPALRRVVWSGIGLPNETLAYWMTRLSHVQFTALYGFSEATIASAYYTFPRGIDGATSPFPVGTACPGEEVLVVNEALGPAGVEEVGEICIRGLGLGPGYWQDPAGTQAVFPRNPSDPMDRLFRTGDLGRLGRDGHIYVIGQMSQRASL